MLFRNGVSSTTLLFLAIISQALLPREARAQSDCEMRSKVPDSVIVDTLPRFENIRGTARDKAGHIRAATDALVGRSSFPPPLVVTKYRRDGSSVLVDLKADSLPKLRWTNAGGLVRIRADGCRIIVTRHN
jgi:hypothetical protein